MRFRILFVVPLLASVFALASAADILDANSICLAILGGPLAEEVAANARLIAAAPKLLSALKGLSDSIDMEQEFEHQLDCDDPESCSLCIARKAISEVEDS